jgi:hypothetical protein
MMARLLNLFIILEIHTQPQKKKNRVKWIFLCIFISKNWKKRVSVRHSLQVGKNYLCADWKQELVTFSEFLERIRSHSCSPVGPTYLAQHPLFDQVFKV